MQNDAQREADRRPGFPDHLRDRIEKREDGCQVWTGRVDRDGYGRFKEDGKDIRTHVRAWEEANGCKVPRGKLVLHACDNPSCVNPEHLRVGTHRDNMRDRQARDRQAKGSRNGRAKLTETQVAAAKRLLADGATTQARLARVLGVDRTTVRDIANGRNWGHVEPE